MDPALQQALASLPPAPHLIAVSGHLDSIALLHLCRHHRPDLPLHVAHLDHQLRGEASRADAAFVAALARTLRLPHTIATLSDLFQDHPELTKIANPQARYRAARLAFFKHLLTEHHLQAVLLAHHQNDQAETLLLRLLRAPIPAALSPMSPSATIQGVPTRRPLLDIPKSTLRAYLEQHNLAWREDATNATDDYRRNTARQLLADHPHLTRLLLDLGQHCAAAHAWLRAITPTLPETFPTRALADLPTPLAHQAARAWLRARGSPPDDLSQKVTTRLLAMATDAASPPRQHFPGHLLVTRKRGTLSATRNAPPTCAADLL